MADISITPDAFDHPTLDGIPIPGTRVVRLDGGDRDMQVEQQRQPGVAGAFTVVRGEEMMLISYDIECADKKTRDEVNAFLPAMRQAQKRRAFGGVNGSFFQPTVFRFYDPALEHNEITSVIVKLVGGWRHELPSRMARVKLVFAENKRRVPIGGLAAPRPKSEIETQIAAINESNKALEKQLATMQKAP